MQYKELTKEADDYVNSFYKEHPDARLFYHNLSKTRETAHTAKIIAEHYRLSERDLFIVYTATLFHDIGYLVAEPKLHELKSAELAENFLVNTGVNEKDISEIKKCIIATKWPQKLVSLNEQIVCDADLFYLGTDKFKENSKLLKKETEALKNEKISTNNWRTKSIKVLEKHRYYTDYCKSLLEKTKIENKDGLIKKQQEKLPETFITPSENDSNKKQEVIRDTAPIKNPAGIKKNQLTERGIQTMFRISSSKSQEISSMADNKAHIMISVNSIIVSVVLGLIVKNIDEQRHLVVPTILLLSVNVITIIYSILATMPRKTSGVFTEQQVENKSVNLLFFGTFYKMGFKGYDTAMRQMMHDDDFLYGSLIKDIYWQGRVLGRKYKLLRISYGIFMYGLIASVIAYTIAIIFY